MAIDVRSAFPSNDLRFDHFDDHLMLFGEPVKISHGMSVAQGVSEREIAAIRRLDRKEEQAALAQ
jgi:hypothetical protein